MLRDAQASRSFAANQIEIEDENLLATGGEDVITLDRSTYTQSIVDPDNQIIFGRSPSENEDEKFQRIY